MNKLEIRLLVTFLVTTQLQINSEFVTDVTGWGGCYKKYILLHISFCLNFGICNKCILLIIRGLCFLKMSFVTLLQKFSVSNYFEV